MIPAYNEIYLDDAMENLGEAVEYACYQCSIDPDSFMHMFSASGISRLFENGNPRFVAGMSGTELARRVLDQWYTEKKWPEPVCSFYYPPEYWAGWTLALYQWRSGRDFESIQSVLPLSDIVRMYHPLHEASESKVVATIDEVIRSREPGTALHRWRTLRGMTQRELSERSGVNIRTLQQYETGARDMNAASFATVTSLADALRTRAIDLIERSPVEGMDIPDPRPVFRGDDMETRTDRLHDLTVDEVYSIYRLRSEVFVAGEGIVYPDPDGEDLRALHVRIMDDEEMLAYARVFVSGPGEATIGRVIAVRKGEGLGTMVMRAAIEAARNELGASRVVLASQLRVAGFYRSLGFREVSDVFDEYGVEHVMMALNI